MANRVGSSSRPVGRASDIDFDAVPSPRPQKSFASSMRRSSIGISLQPSPPGAGGDVPSDDDIFDGGADEEEPESPSPSKQQQTSRRIGASNAVQDGEDVSTPKARSKGKAKARDENHDGKDNDEDAGRDLNDAEMQQEDEEPTPKKKPTGKRPRKKAVEFPCKRPLP